MSIKGVLVLSLLGRKKQKQRRKVWLRETKSRKEEFRFFGNLLQLVVKQTCEEIKGAAVSFEVTFSKIYRIIILIIREKLRRLGEPRILRYVFY